MVSSRFFFPSTVFANSRSLRNPPPPSPPPPPPPLHLHLPPLPPTLTTTTTTPQTSQTTSHSSGYSPNRIFLTPRVIRWRLRVRSG
jgi:hypothetical protein